MKIQRIHNAKRNIIFGVLNKIILLLLPFLIRTIMIYEIGVDYLGLNSLFSSILQVLSLTELGFSSAIVYFLYKPIADGDTELICAYMAFYKRIYRWAGIAAGLIGILILPFLRHFIKGDLPTGINIYSLYLICLFNTVIGYFIFGYKNVLFHAHQRDDVISKISTFCQCCMCAGQILVLLAAKNYYGYLLLMPIFTLVNHFIIGYLAKKMYPQYVSEGSLDETRRDQIKNKVAGLMIHRICLVSRNSFDSIFISACLGLTAAAMYSNYYYIMNAIVGILAVTGTAILAGVGNSMAVEGVEKNYTDMMKINFIYMIISGWSAICLLCLYQPFMELWVGKELMFDFKVVLLICVYFYVLKMGDIRGTYSDAAGLWWENRYRAVIEAAMNFILNAVFVQIWGIYGIISATLISLFVVNFIFGSRIIFKYYFKHIRSGEYFFSHLKYGLTTAVTGLITWCLTSLIKWGGWTGLCVKLVVCVVVPGCLYFVFYFKTQEYKIAREWIMERILK